jgi:hypothetical protein
MSQFPAAAQAFATLGAAALINAVVRIGMRRVFRRIVALSMAAMRLSILSTQRATSCEPDSDKHGHLHADERKPGSIDMG